MRYKVADYYVYEVVTEKPLCDGCCFERSVFGRTCNNLSIPECHHFGREDGKNVIFRAPNGAMRKMRDNGGESHSFE